MRSDPHQAEDSRDRKRVRQVLALATSHAEDGESLEVLYAALDDLIDSRDRAEDDDMLRLASMTWAEAFVTRLNRLTCADPVTGLSSVHHLITYLEGASRRRGSMEDLALIVIEVVSRRNAPDCSGEERLGQSLRLAVVADTLDAWFEDSITIRAAVSPRRVALLVDREAGLAKQATDLAVVITSRLRLAPDGHSARARVVPLPADFAAAVSVIEELNSSAT